MGKLRIDRQVRVYKIIGRMPQPDFKAAHIVDITNGQLVILPCDGNELERSELIVAAVNACMAINSTNPMAVADNIQALWGGQQIS